MISRTTQCQLVAEGSENFGDIHGRRIQMPLIKRGYALGKPEKLLVAGSTSPRR